MEGSASPQHGGQDTFEDDDGLFGSGSEAEASHLQPKHDDANLDLSEDEERWDRRDVSMNEDGPEYSETLNIMDLNLGRTAEPESTDGHIYTLAVPNFLAIESEDFTPENYVAPPFFTASTSLCWRYSPVDKDVLQSNARIIRWSDGSLTLQLASNPTDQYRITSKPLARPHKRTKLDDYDADMDTHTYLAAPAEASSVILLTSHLTSSLAVLPTTVETDDAVQRLQESLAAATRTGNKNPDGSVSMFDVKVDPELAKKQAEQAEREKLREARKRQAATERDIERGRRLGGYSRTGGAGLTIAGLEDDDGMMKSHRRPQRKTKRRGDFNSDDEDDYRRRGRTREDEYDEDDGFLVASDEEPEFDDDEEEEEEEGDDLDAEGENDEEVLPPKPGASARESAPADEGGVEEKSPSAATPGMADSSQARKKNRYVVGDDDDEE